MKILLIRHGMTQGNSEKRYIGRTDEPLCPDGLAQVQALARAGTLPPCDFVFASPLLRCRQTAETLFSNQKVRTIGDLAECDFGHFEGRTAADLAADAEYGHWVASGSAEPIPGGEDVGAFRKRSTEAFFREVSALPENSTAAFVIHGGVIMAILERFAEPKRSFYEYHLENCQYYVCRSGGAAGAEDTERSEDTEGAALVITEWPVS